MSKPARRIESASNQTLKGWRTLHKRRERDRSRRFIIEGEREIGRAFAAEVHITDILLGDAATPSERALAGAIADGGANPYEVGEAALSAVSVRSHPSQIIAIAVTPLFDLGAIQLHGVPLVLIADAIEKPGNIGAMIRSGDGAGVDAIVVSDQPGDMVNPNVIRASQGAVFSAPIAAAEGAAVEQWLAANGISAIAASDTAPAALWDIDMTDPLAIVVGSEHAGLSSTWRHCPTVAIPMGGASDSLNAAVAAAILLYEARRQRSR